MGHLYYDELRNIANTNIGGNTNFKKGPFKNLIPFQYYSADRVGFNDSDVYFFDFNFGETSYGFEATNRYALAVHSGNVGAPVPIPGAVWLLGPGLIGLLGMRRLRR